MTATVEHEPWCEDQATGHEGPCRFYGDSLSARGVVVTSTAEAVDGGAVVVLTTTGRDGRPVRLEVAPAVASSFGRSLTRLGSTFEDRAPRRSPLATSTTATARGGVVVSR
ncbi:hypothetical protein [Jiangella mangrovi]|uniref:Uncharacterized protein n=1 Tax=Jiangella mangrovi TaxID=1524084 RepID=A0A7W9GKY6_9ACTN|nr:hypothetical protein [Jiangella mangrovi]MBB5785588.1 hypothetical protein [Jiangella mangrovi]